MGATLGIVLALIAFGGAVVGAFIGAVGGPIVSRWLQSKDGDLDRAQQLFLAALDKRLQAHQDAFTVCRKIALELRRDQKVLTGLILDAQELYDQKALYMDKEVSDALLLCKNVAGSWQHPDPEGWTMDYSLERSRGNSQSLRSPALRERRGGRVPAIRSAGRLHALGLGPMSTSFRWR